MPKAKKKKTQPVRHEPAAVQEPPPGKKLSKRARKKLEKQQAAGTNAEAAPEKEGEAPQENETLLWQRGAQLVNEAAELMDKDGGDDDGDDSDEEVTEAAAKCHEGVDAITKVLNSTGIPLPLVEQALRAFEMRLRFSVAFKNVDLVAADLESAYKTLAAAAQEGADSKEGSGDSESSDEIEELFGEAVAAWKDILSLVCAGGEQGLSLEDMKKLREGLTPEAEAFITEELAANEIPSHAWLGKAAPTKKKKKKKKQPAAA